MASITTGLKELQPIIHEVAHKLPEGSESTLKLLNESVTILQVMQKSFLLRSNVEEVKKEALRMPTSAGRP